MENGRDGERGGGTLRGRERIFWPLAHIKNRNMLKFILDGSRANGFFFLVVAIEASMLFNLRN